MRAIDADALEKEGWSLHRTIRVDKNTSEYQTKPLRQVPAIEPRKKGKWLTSDDLYETGICSCCRYDTQEPVSYVITNFGYCPNCGADMTEGEG